MLETRDWVTSIAKDDHGLLQGLIIFEHKLVDIAPHPVLTGFKRADDGMLGGMEVFCGVLVLRGIAAPHVATGETEAEVDPRIAHFEAFFATF